MIAVLGCATSARALELVVMAPIPTTATDFNMVIPIAQFDPNLGQLLMVTVRLNATLNASLIAENRSAQPAQITGSVTEAVTLTPPVGPILTDSASTSPVGAQLVGPYDGTPFTNELPNGPFGADTFRWAITPADGTVDEDNQYVLPADLAVFTGNGSLNYNVVGDSSTMLSSNTGNLAALATATIGGTITVTYEYIPEPATLGMLGIGALFLVRRRR